MITPRPIIITRIMIHNYSDHGPGPRSVPGSQPPERRKPGRRRCRGGPRLSRAEPIIPGRAVPGRAAAAAPPAAPARPGPDSMIIWAAGAAAVERRPGDAAADSDKAEAMSAMPVISRPPFQSLWPHILSIMATVTVTVTVVTLLGPEPPPSPGRRPSGN